MNPISLSDILTAVETAQSAYAGDSSALSTAQAKVSTLTSTVNSDAVALNQSIATAVEALQALVVPGPVPLP